MTFHNLSWRTGSIAAITICSAVLILHSSCSALKKGKRDEDEKAKEKPTTENDLLLDSLELPTHIKREIRKEKRRQAQIPNLARKSPMYDNVQMIGLDDELLSSISAKKGRWYVQKGLAEWKTSTQIQLKFEPKGRSGNGQGGTYIKSKKENICVSCGNNQYIMKHYVVPYIYRSMLPPNYKSHLSHDIVVLCPECHLHCEQQVQKRIKQINNVHRSISEDASHPRIIDKRLKKVRSAALTLLNWKEKVPPAKIMEYEDMIRSHLSLEKSDDLTPNQLQKAIDVEYRFPNPNYVSGVELVMQALGGDDVKIGKFIRKWRQHFLDTVEPRFLPNGWSIHSPVTCDKDDA